MSLLAAYDLFLQYGEKVLFDGDSIAVEAKDRLGVVGPNGSGKSTLLKILIGRVEPDKGRVVRAKGLRVGYLAQEFDGDPDAPLLESVLRAAPGKAALEAELADTERALERADGEEQIQLSERLAELHVELSDIERHFAPHEARRILLGLGFDPDDFDRPISHLSGGWRMRAQLAALLFQQPEVLLLDEPTNHLDMPSVHWLNRFLDHYRHAIVLVCHDKEFLNRHVSRIASFEVEGLRVYRGDFDDYRRQRELDLELLENRARRDEQRKKELEAFVERFRAKASKARQAQSKARLIEKMQEEQVEIPRVRRSIHVRFAPAPPSGDPVLETEDLSFAYGDHEVLRGVRLEVRKGDRIAIVGRNGAGKTTLLKLLAGELAPKRGAIRSSTKTRPSYFAQHHADALDPSMTVLDTVWRAAPDVTQSAARTFCGSFLFAGDEVEKPVSVLSGGEKTRVALARILIRPGNLLLLDEPTNHLDTDSAERLVESLLTFDGTIVFVSHNLDFARRLSNKVWIVDGGSVRPFPGSLSDYLHQVDADQEKREREVLGHLAAGKKPRTGGGTTDKAARMREREERKARQRERTRLERRVRELEEEIQALEMRKTALEGKLADPAVYDDRDESDRLAAEFRRATSELQARMSEWEEASFRLEELGSA